MKNLDPERARWIRVRMGLLCGLMALGLGGVVSGAYRVRSRTATRGSSSPSSSASGASTSSRSAARIYDRNGAPLAESVEVPSVSRRRGRDAPRHRRAVRADARSQQYAERIAAGARRCPVEDVVEKLARRRRFAWLKRRVSEEEVAERPRARRSRPQRYPMRGLDIEGEGHRFYPNRELAGPLLGFVAPDGEGKDGLELSLDHELRGPRVARCAGCAIARAACIFSEGIEDEQALAGHNVYLTIDKGIQFTAERELEAAMRTYEAQRRLDRRRSIRAPARSSRWRARPGTTRTTTAQSDPEHAAQPRASPIASSPARR